MFILLFVDSPQVSSQFYQKLFDLKPIEESPTFALFALNQGMPGFCMLGLWSRHTAEPKVTAFPGCSEIAFAEENPDALYAAWQKKGISFAQPPTDMDFGRTFLALDPDGHRIRVFKATP